MRRLCGKRVRWCPAQRLQVLRAHAYTDNYIGEDLLTYTPAPTPARFWLQGPACLPCVLGLAEPSTHPWDRR